MKLKLYPNPNYGSFFVEAENLETGDELLLSVTNGSKINMFKKKLCLRDLKFKAQRIDLVGVAPGQYHFYLYNKRSQYLYKFQVLDRARPVILQLEDEFENRKVQ
jgi:hypothetical protein